jgi:hypothetical protein
MELSAMNSTQTIIMAIMAVPSELRVVDFSSSILNEGWISVGYKR